VKTSPVSTQARPSLLAVRHLLLAMPLQTPAVLSSRATTWNPLSVFGADASTSHPSWMSWPATVGECRSRLVSDQGWPHASPPRRSRKAIRCHMAYSWSVATRSRNAPACSGVQTLVHGKGALLLVGQLRRWLPL
jgi:hypothetical protein